MQRCFADINGGKPENKAAYTCYTCNENTFICEKCAKKCNNGHKVAYVGEKKYTCGCYLGRCGRYKISQSLSNDSPKSDENQSSSIQKTTKPEKISQKMSPKSNITIHNISSANQKVSNDSYQVPKETTSIDESKSKINKPISVSLDNTEEGINSFKPTKPVNDLRQAKEEKSFDSSNKYFNSYKKSQKL